MHNPKSEILRCDSVFLFPCAGRPNNIKIFLLDVAKYVNWPYLAKNASLVIMYTHISHLVYSR